jgi:O-succinylbenzoic acid--CoA ligase
MTEAASQIATATPAETAADPGTVGRPLLGTRLAVLDGAGDELPPGEVGEFVVRGPTVTPG